MHRCVLLLLANLMGSTTGPHDAWRAPSLAGLRVGASGFSDARRVLGAAKVRDGRYEGDRTICYAAGHGPPYEVLTLRSSDTGGSGEVVEVIHLEAAGTRPEDCAPLARASAPLRFSDGPQLGLRREQAVEALPGAVPDGESRLRRERRTGSEGHVTIEWEEITLERGIVVELEVGHVEGGG